MAEREREQKRQLYLLVFSLSLSIPIMLLMFGFDFLGLAKTLGMEGLRGLPPFRPRHPGPVHRRLPVLRRYLLRAKKPPGQHGHPDRHRLDHGLLLLGGGGLPAGPDPVPSPHLLRHLGDDHLADPVRQVSGGQGQGSHLPGHQEADRPAGPHRPGAQGRAGGGSTRRAAEGRRCLRRPAGGEDRHRRDQ